MSILLEALRKSENSQRTRQAPTIHSEVPSTPPGTLANRLVIGALLVLTLVVCTWFAWQQFRAPVSVDATAVLSKERVSSRESEASVGLDMPAEKKPSSLKAAGAQESSATTAAPADPGLSDEPASASRPRTPVESYQAPETTNDQDTNSEAPVITAGDVKPIGSKPDKSQQALGERKSRGEPGDIAGQGDKSAQPAEPQMLGYWDLPDNVRSSIPEFSFTVLVYDKKPENRFVLINGERYVEGDTQQPGLVVEEIRRDGVVYSYRLYRFLVEK